MSYRNGVFVRRREGREDDNFICFPRILHRKRGVGYVLHDVPIVVASEHAPTVTSEVMDGDFGGYGKLDGSVGRRFPLFGTRRLLPCNGNARIADRVAMNHCLAGVQIEILEKNMC